MMNKVRSGQVAHPDWKQEDGSTYTKNGWMVWTTGYCWKVKNPDGYVYAAEYAQKDTAIRHAEKRMK